MKAKYLLYAMALVVLPSMMVSCGDDGADIDDNPTEKPGDNPSKPDLEPANEEWAPEKQQQYLLVPPFLLPQLPTHKMKDFLQFL